MRFCRLSEEYLSSLEESWNEYQKACVSAIEDISNQKVKQIDLEAKNALKVDKYNARKVQKWVEGRMKLIREWISKENQELIRLNNNFYILFNKIKEDLYSSFDFGTALVYNFQDFTRSRTKYGASDYFNVRVIGQTKTYKLKDVEPTTTNFVPPTPQFGEWFDY